MGAAINGVDYVSAPRDYADLFRIYYEYVVAVVRRAGIEASRAEDVASEILLRFYERDFLSKFDPTLVFKYGGEDRPARFKSFLTKFVLIYARGHFDKQQRTAHREILVCNRPMGDRDTTDWFEIFGGTVDGADLEVLEALEEKDLVQHLRAYVAQVPRRSSFDACDLVLLFDAVIDQIRTQGSWDIAALRAHFGISSTAMHSWMWWLRANLADALGRPVPAKRPRRTVK